MNRITAVLLAVCLFLSLCICPVGASSEPDDVFSVPELGEVSIHTEAQKAALASPDDAPAVSDRNPYPLPVEIRWGYAGSAEEFTVSLSTTPDMTESASFVCGEEYQTDEGYVLPIYNLLIGVPYYYTISDGVNTSAVLTFSIEDAAPRNLFVEGVDNIRDMGGWPTEDGGCVRQGLACRSAHPNTENTARGSNEMLITEASFETLLGLGIRTQIDLRSMDSSEMTESDFGPDVTFVLEQFTEVPEEVIMDPTVDHIAKQSEIFSDENGRAAIADVFRHFADEENYPIVVNCSAGRDRTGLITFLLNALLGVSEEDLYRDYMFSNLSVRRESRGLENYLSNDLGQIIDYEGDALSEKAYNYMLDIGLTEEEIASIIRIMKEPGQSQTSTGIPAGTPATNIEKGDKK